MNSFGKEGSVGIEPPTVDRNKKKYPKLEVLEAMWLNRPGPKNKAKICSIPILTTDWYLE